MHVQDIRHERERRKLVREVFAEEPELGERRIDFGEILEDEIVRHPFFLDRCVGFEPSGSRLLSMFLFGVNGGQIYRSSIKSYLAFYQGPHFVHGEENRK